MSNIFPDDLAAQIRQIRESISTVESLQKSIQSASAELLSAGRLSTETLQKLDEIAHTTASALVKVASTGAAIDEIRQASGKTIADLTASLQAATSTLENSVRNMAEGVMVLPDVLKQLQQSTVTIQDGLRSAIKDVVDLQQSTLESFEVVAGRGMMGRLDFLIPSAIVGTILGLSMPELGTPRAVVWLLITLLPAAFGVSAKLVWTEATKIFNSIRK